MKPKDSIQRLLDLAGISINGNKPWDMQVHNEALYSRILRKGSLGAGEAYMDGWWDCQALDQFFYKFLVADLEARIKPGVRDFLAYLRASFLNLQKLRSSHIGEFHYDLGNDLFERMLDPRMVYTCGYWKGTEDLNQAQENKLDLACRKIGLQAGDRVLDIGSGFGSFINFAAEKYGVNPVGISVSSGQKAWADQHIPEGKEVKTRILDYRKVEGTFDHVVSIGMFEAVGYKNFRTYMRKVHELLSDKGLFLLHTIGGNQSVKRTNAWINKYIFPNGMIPSIAQIGKSIEGLFVMEDWHNFGTHYDRTLMAWHRNFEAAWPDIKDKYGERFYRMWRYYLLSCAGAFRARDLQLWQIVLSKPGRGNGYEAVR